MSQLNLCNRPSRQCRQPDRFSFSAPTSNTTTGDESSSECSTASSYSDVISPSSDGDITSGIISSHKHLFGGTNKKIFGDKCDSLGDDGYENDSSYCDVNNVGDLSCDEAPSKNNSSSVCELTWTSSQEISESTSYEDSTVSPLSFNNTQRIDKRNNIIAVANLKKVPRHISVIAKETQLNRSALSVKVPIVSKVDWVCYPIDNKCSCKMLCTSSQ